VGFRLPVTAQPTSPRSGLAQLDSTASRPAATSARGFAVAGLRPAVSGTFGSAVLAFRGSFPLTPFGFPYLDSSPTGSLTAFARPSRSVAHRGAHASRHSRRGSGRGGVAGGGLTCASTLRRNVRGAVAVPVGKHTPRWCWRCCRCPRPQISNPLLDSARGARAVRNPDRRATLSPTQPPD